MEYKNVVFALMAVSALTGLVVQAIKIIMAEHHAVMKKPNTVAGVVAVILSALLGIGYVLYTATAWNIQIVFTLIALAILSWLCAMLGYDKVMQTLAQLKR